MVVAVCVLAAVLTVYFRRAARTRKSTSPDKNEQQHLELERLELRHAIEANTQMLSTLPGQGSSSGNPPLELAEWMIRRVETETSTKAQDKASAETMPIMAAISGLRSPSVRRAPSADVDPRRVLEVENGKLVEKIPRKMVVGVREPVEVRLGRQAENIGHGLVGSGTLTEHTVDIVETMAVELLAPDGAFTIEGASPTIQLVKRDVLSGTGYERFADEWGKWIWYVTPRERGSHPLSIRVSASVLDSRRVPTSATLPDKNIEIAVAISVAKTTGAIIGKGARLAAGAVVTGIVGGFTKDYWWPLLRAVLDGLGLSVPH